MSLSNVSETALLALVFNNTSWANVGDATGLVGSTAAGSFFIALHTADPGEAGNQSTSEANYTGYARVAKKIAFLSPMIKSSMDVPTTTDSSNLSNTIPFLIKF